VPITLNASADSFHVGLLLRDTPNDGVLDLALTGLMHAIRAGRRINLEKIVLRASKSFR
jgi:hypothetical protein